MPILLRRVNLDTSSTSFCFFCAVADICLVLLLAFTCEYLFDGLFPTRERSFLCDDPSIMKPFKPNTVTVKMLLLVCMTVPFVYCVVVETWSEMQRHNRDHQHWLKHSIANWTFVFLEYMLGLLAVVLLMLAGKCWFGTLRPHFLDVCKLDLDAQHCVGKVLTIAHCTQTSNWALISARHSFPSGHAAAAVYAFVFLLLYSRQRWHELQQISSQTKLFANVLCFMFAVWTCFCCLTRITDNWHHPIDVVGGILLGVVCALALFIRQNSAIHVRHHQRVRHIEHH